MAREAFGGGERRAESEKQRMGEWLWLRYYNDALFDRGTITETERDLMSARIDARNGRNWPIDSPSGPGL